jgi:hypothetical protein
LPFDVSDGLGGHVDFSRFHGGEWVLEHDERVRCRAPEVAELFAPFIDLFAGSDVNNEGGDDGNPG